MLFAQTPKINTCALTVCCHILIHGFEFELALWTPLGSERPDMDILPSGYHVLCIGSVTWDGERSTHHYITYLVHCAIFHVLCHMVLDGYAWSVLLGSTQQMLTHMWVGLCPFSWCSLSSSSVYTLFRNWNWTNSFWIVLTLCYESNDTAPKHLQLIRKDQLKIVQL